MQQLVFDALYLISTYMYLDEGRRTGPTTCQSAYTLCRSLPPGGTSGGGGICLRIGAASRASPPRLATPAPPPTPLALANPPANPSAGEGWWPRLRSVPKTNPAEPRLPSAPGRTRGLQMVGDRSQMPAHQAPTQPPRPPRRPATSPHFRSHSHRPDRTHRAPRSDQRCPAWPPLPPPQLPAASHAAATSLWPRSRQLEASAATVVLNKSVGPPTRHTPVDRTALPLP